MSEQPPSPTTLAAKPTHPDLSALMASRPRQVPVTTCLLLFNLGVFGLMLAFGGSVWQTSTTVPLAWGANFGPATQDGQWWRLVTAMCVHFGVLHLGLNMLALWDVGRLVERLFGRWRFLLLYLGGGVLGNLLSLVVQGNQAVSGGASGAIFGLYGALLVFLVRERKQVERREFRWMFGAAVIFTVLTLGMGQVVHGIDNAAHLGGLAGGAIFGSLLARPLSASSPSPRRWWAAACLVVGVTVLLQRLPEPRYLMGNEMRARAAIQQFLNADRLATAQWGSILAKGRQQGVSFDELAGNIDNRVTRLYVHSFEQLMAADPGPEAPSARTLEALQDYASARAQASHEMAQDLRSKNFGKINKALTRPPALPRPPPAMQAPARQTKGRDD
ncbi:rhomboid family intramembrane serine protease [Rhodoferax sp. U11-2br]|uniref:rhomboid family intramembrane serine protease n=1 Tax=Rhodoferax sp. U11-2br TaxID=2838878 RepID=UPI001BE5D981|nr:rhomboid family intramembrane serine protease [Rhodoferax sp. U11-2br]MBT3068287.1 rhomboid family intramembrane serine protease [Rhodoferax sp. U11-2br]